MEPIKTRGYKNSKIDLTAEFVRQIFHYDPLTGELTWKSPPCSGLAGKQAGGINKHHGRIQVWIQGQLYYAHRIIWLYMTGEWPEYEIDHEDRNRANNIWTNLRSATSSQNNYNRPILKNNKTNFKGVSRSGNRWKARIRNAGRIIYLGYFYTPEEAHEAYVEAASRIAGSFARAE